MYNSCMACIHTSSSQKLEMRRCSDVATHMTMGYTGSRIVCTDHQAFGTFITLHPSHLKRAIAKKVRCTSKDLGMRHFDVSGAISSKSGISS